MANGCPVTVEEAESHSMQSFPKSQGLYDPQCEHDACGIGAIVNISGSPQPCHRGIRQAGAVEPDAPRGGRGRRIDRRRGGHPHADCRTSSSRPRPTGWVSLCPRRGSTAWRWSFCRDDVSLAAAVRGDSGRGDRATRPGGAGLARRAQRRPLPGRFRPRLRAGHPPDFHRRRRASRTRSWSGGCIVARKRAERLAARVLGPIGRRVLRALDVVPHDLLQGDVPGAAVVRVLSRPGRSADDARPWPSCISVTARTRSRVGGWRSRSA